MTFFFYIKYLHDKPKVESPGIYLIDIPGSEKEKIKLHNINQKISLTKMSQSHILLRTEADRIS